ncbi:MAG: adenylate/guanylate cyclase domain-containing protein, partial [Actinomycetota bacterium]|nr:adenylate/guanylate cyclase domain-containing protein [Actinomycetota bacterium]
MDATLLPYVPRLAAEWDLDAPGASWRSLDATCCFVDISGFTALSERLARRGRIGAEELTEVLNHVFSRMLGVAYEKGGSLLKFGGDALLLAFDADDHAVLGAQAAVAMRAALREARTLPTSVGRLNLRMSVGLHSGAFDFFRVGASHHELLVAGPSATSTTRMEQTADAGEIVISASTAERLPAGAVGAEKGDGRLLRWRGVVPGGPGARGIRQSNSAEIAAGVPVALREHLREGGGESEHRVASIGFVKFQGVDDYLATYGSDATAEALNEIVTCVQHAVDEERVTFLASDIDANGGKIILVAGVPLAQDDDEGRMLRTARTIVEREFAIPVRIGVNRGHVFAGEIGTEFRRTFTVMGDTVNLA